MNNDICGIDFGTSNSLFTYSPDGRAVTVVPVDPPNWVPELLPSLLYFNRFGQHRAGREAFNEFRRHPEEYDSRMIRSLKSALVELAPDDSVKIFGRAHTMSELCSLLIRRLKEEGERFTGRTFTGAVIGRPVRFSDHPLLDAQAQESVRQGAILAGFDPAAITFLPEPEAVMRLFAAQGGAERPDLTAMVFDFGGGTLDLCLARAKDGRFTVLANRGARIGGTTLDRRLFEEKLLPRLGQGQQWGPGLDLPAFVLNRLVNPDESWRIPDVVHARSVRQIVNAAASVGRRSPELQALAIVASARQGPELFAAIEQAKIELSERVETRIEYRFRDVALSEPLSRGDIERIFADELAQIDRLVDETLATGGLAAGQVDAVLLAGGSSNLVTVQERLARLFGPERVQRRSDTFTSVAQGLAIAAWSRCDAAAGSPGGAGGTLRAQVCHPEAEGNQGHQTRDPAGNHPDSGPESGTALANRGLP